MYKDVGYAIVRLEDNASIPKTELNSDYLKYLDWLADGNIPEDGTQTSFLISKETELSNFRASRELYLNRLTGIGMAAQFEGREAALAAVIKVRKGLLSFTSLPSVTGATALDELKAAMKQAYAALLVGVPAEVKAAFKGVDA